mmetsp:Transcript_7089/g.10598  ORF Transcript_7089/g.10598 Transcript_7089/m.10598 type:complete len:232 (+) Transcript_7089:65-760(+)
MKIIAIVALIPTFAAAFTASFARPSKVRLNAEMDVDKDMERAIECADHYGQCDVEEIEDLMQKIHQKRLNAALTGTDHISPAEESQALNQLVLEEDLELQLAMLKREMQPNDLDLLVDEEFKSQVISLRDEVETDVEMLPSDEEILGNFKNFIPKAFMKNPFDSINIDMSGKAMTASGAQATSTDNVPEPSMDSFVNSGFKAMLMDEGIEEAIVLCGAVLLLALMPHIFGL